MVQAPSVRIDVLDDERGYVAQPNASEPVWNPETTSAEAVKPPQVLAVGGSRGKVAAAKVKAPRAGCLPATWLGSSREVAGGWAVPDTYAEQQLRLSFTLQQLCLSLSVAPSPPSDGQAAAAGHGTTAPGCREEDFEMLPPPPIHVSTALVLHTAQLDSYLPGV